ncbi:MAG: zinc-ribbon domain-containing protein, partial [Burkholderiaceae bacterium]
MSFTTRCPACGTMFRVVPDQLKISDGWVRCGHCSDVFDAMLNLQESVAPAPPQARPASVPAGGAKAPVPAETGAPRVVIRRTPIPAPAPSAPPATVPASLSPPSPPPPSPPPPPSVRQAATQAPAPIEVDPPPFSATVPMSLEGLAPLAAQSTADVLPNPHAAVVPAAQAAVRSDKVAAPPEDESALLLGAGEADADQWDHDWLLSPSNISRHREAVEQELRSQAGKGAGVPRKPQPVDPEFERELGAFAGLTGSASVPPAQSPEASPAPSPAPAPVTTQVKEPAPPPSAAAGETQVRRSTFGPPAPPEAAGSQWAMSQLEADDPDSGFGAEPAEPTFVVKARRDAFWRTPVMRGLLLLMAIALGALLGLQWASFERDQL